MTNSWRVMIALVVVVAAMAQGGCGRKQKLTPPPGAHFPQQYPRE